MQWKRVDNGYWVALALCVLAALPFLLNSSLPHDTDAELHIFRLAELDRMWRGGIFYPRWAANFYFGFGYPIFNFYAPLTYYIGLLFNLLPGFDPVMSSKAVLLLGLVGAALGMYGFVRDQFGRMSGFVAAASYLYAPYILYIDPHGRGVLPESFSFCVFPFALWSVDKLLRRPTAKRLLITVLLLGAIITTHNLMAMVFGGLLFAYFLWQVLVVGRGDFGRNGTLLSLAAFALGVGLAAFFWLPMVFEQDAIQISTVIGEGSHYDFRNHFLSIGELFGPMPRFDWGASEPYFTRSLGLAQWGIGLVGLLRALFGRHPRRKQVLFFALLAAILIFLMTPLSLALWRSIPLLPFLQFPWRLLGATNAMLAVLGGFAVALPTGSSASSQASGRATQLPTVAAVLVGMTLLLALPLTQIKPWPEFGPTSARAVLESELAGRWRGTTSTADFVPATVDVAPREQDPILRQIEQGGPIDPLNRATLGTATVTTETLTPTHFRFTVDADEFVVLRMFLFDFPGWEATVDGVSAEIELAQPDGFITIPVDAGEHVVELRFTDTVERQLGWTITLGSLLGAMLIGVWFGRKYRSTESEPETALVSQQGLTRIAAAISAVTIVHLLLLNPSGVLHYDSQGSIVQAAEIDDADFTFEDKIDLIGYTLPDQLRPDRTHELTLYWKAKRPLDENYQVFVHLLHPELGLVAQSDKLNPGDFPTKNWTDAEYIRDPHRLLLPADLPAGDYTLTVGLWNAVSGARLSTITVPEADSAPLRSYQVEK